MIDVERSSVAPRSLARKRSWAGFDVLEALHRDFHGKCYLCERVLMIGEIQVDHRRPRSCWPAGKCHWPNLFPACVFCNGRRSKSYPSVGLLSPGDGVERRVIQKAQVAPGGKAIECWFAAADRGDAMAQATANELGSLHSDREATTTRARCATRDFLDTIDDHYFERVLPLKRRVLRARERGRREQAIEVALANVLSRRAPFTMLMRCLATELLSDLFD